MPDPLCCIGVDSVVDRALVRRVVRFLRARVDLVGEETIPAERAGGYTAVMVILWIVLYFVVAAIIGVVVAMTVGTAALAGAAAMGG